MVVTRGQKGIKNPIKLDDEFVSSDQTFRNKKTEKRVTKRNSRIKNDPQFKKNMQKYKEEVAKKLRDENKIINQATNEVPPIIINQATNETPPIIATYNADIDSEMNNNNFAEVGYYEDEYVDETAPLVLDTNIDASTNAASNDDVVRNDFQMDVDAVPERPSIVPKISKKDLINKINQVPEVSDDTSKFPIGYLCLINEQGNIGMNFDVFHDSCVGRHHECKILSFGSGVEAFHASFSFNKSKSITSIKPESSTCKIYINNQLIKDVTELRTGYAIRFGEDQHNYLFSYFRLRQRDVVEGKISMTYDINTIIHQNISDYHDGDFNKYLLSDDLKTAIYAKGHAFNDYRLRVSVTALKKQNILNDTVSSTLEQFYRLALTNEGASSEEVYSASYARIEKSCSYSVKFISSDESTCFGDVLSFIRITENDATKAYAVLRVYEVIGVCTCTGSAILNYQKLPNIQCIDIATILCKVKFLHVRAPMRSIQVKKYQTAQTTNIIGPYSVLFDAKSKDDWKLREDFIDEA